MISAMVLAGISVYGAPLLGLVLLVGAAGFPLPLSLMVFAAGAFSRQGIISWYYAAGLGLAGTVIGDSLSFSLGRWGGERLNRRFGDSTLWVDAQTTFSRGSGVAIFFTRFMLTAMAVPVNLMAGSTCRFRNFLVYDLAGESLWILLYGGLGFLFGSQWELIRETLGDFGWLLLVLAVVAGGLYLVLQQWDRRSGLRLQSVEIPVVQSH